MNNIPIDEVKEEQLLLLFSSVKDFLSQYNGWPRLSTIEWDLHYVATYNPVLFAVLINNLLQKCTSELEDKENRLLSYKWLQICSTIYLETNVNSIKSKKVIHRKIVKSIQ